MFLVFSSFKIRSTKSFIHLLFHSIFTLIKRRIIKWNSFSLSGPVDMIIAQPSPKRRTDSIYINVSCGLTVYRLLCMHDVSFNLNEMLNFSFSNAIFISFLFISQTVYAAAAIVLFQFQFDSFDWFSEFVTLPLYCITREKKPGI